MILNVRNKWVSLRGGSKVTDVNENEVMYVKGKFWTFTRKKFVQTMDGKLLYTVRNKFWVLFAKKAMIYNSEGVEIARIRRKVFSLHDHYDIKSSLGEVTIRGNILGFDYHIVVNGKEVGHIARKISLRDSYVLEISDDFDPALFVAFTIAIDNIVDSMKEESASVGSSY